MIERAAAGAGLEIKAHPHMLRHACGYALANKGHDTPAIQGWLGHRSITSTAVGFSPAPTGSRTASRFLPAARKAMLPRSQAGRKSCRRTMAFTHSVPPEKSAERTPTKERLT
jgi:hypothetical protein